MKKVFVLIAVIAIMLGTAYAGTTTNCGCGIGTMVWGEKDGLVFQLLATCTNGFMGNQTFGISSGTLGCEKAPSIASIKGLDIFVADNMDNLAVDMAVGEGEALDALAEIVQMPEAKRTTFFATLQANFDTIYSSDQVKHQDVVNQISMIIKQV